MKILSLPVNLLLIAYSLVIFATPQEITGHYTCRGDDFINKTTFEEPTIVTRTGDTFQFQWINKNIIFRGTGIKVGNQLSVVFWTPSHLGSFGTVCYQILANGDLKGKWTIKESDMTGNEYCERLK